MSVEIRRSATRFTSRDTGRQTRHSFSFGAHYDPERTGFGAMVCHDDHHLRGGTGFETHRHAGIEILTWVVSGALHFGVYEKAETKFFQTPFREGMTFLDVGANIGYYTALAARADNDDLHGVRQQFGIVDQRRHRRETLADLSGERTHQSGGALEIGVLGGQMIEPGEDADLWYLQYVFKF